MEKFNFLKRIVPVFLVVMMLCMMSVTALAAEAVPDGYTLMENGGQWKYGSKTAFPGYKGATYTIETIDTQAFVLSVHGINPDGTTVELYKHSGAVKSYTYTADGSYEYLTLVCAPGAQRDATVTWTEPEPPSLADEIASIMAGIGACFTGSLSWVGDVGEAIMSTPLLFAGAVGIPFVGLGIVLFKRIFKRG